MRAIDDSHDKITNRFGSKLGIWNGWHASRRENRKESEISGADTFF